MILHRDRISQRHLDLGIMARAWRPKLPATLGFGHHDAGMATEFLGSTWIRASWRGHGDRNYRQHSSSGFMTRAWRPNFSAALGFGRHDRGCVL
ncbi:hypothetical protein HUG15_07725 [Salicibibacter cibarius]|uniref:Uncharacterized protein n=1 Tax=Salicibibacter cibarius TaxID=2743000 RepID=A0A7T6Z1X3_9BACI|nr:hypothetical protein HUG15_07725 [Salicibibacter cibarius]